MWLCPIAPRRRRPRGARVVALRAHACARHPPRVPPPSRDGCAPDGPGRGSRRLCHLGRRGARPARREKGEPSPCSTAGQRRQPDGRRSRWWSHFDQGPRSPGQQKFAIRGGQAPGRKGARSATSPSVNRRATRPAGMAAVQMVKSSCPEPSSCLNTRSGQGRRAAGGGW